MLKRIKTLALPILFASLTSFASAAEPMFPPLPAPLLNAKPVSILPADPAKEFAFKDDINTKEAPGSFTFAGQQDGKLIFRAENFKGSSNYDGIRANWSSTQKIKKGDVMFGRFAARALRARQESGEAEGMF